MLLRKLADTTVRRTLELADPRTLDKIARVRARIRGHVWSLIAATPAGFPWLTRTRRSKLPETMEKDENHSDLTPEWTPSL